MTRAGYRVQTMLDRCRYPPSLSIGSWEWMRCVLFLLSYGACPLRRSVFLAPPDRRFGSIRLFQAIQSQRMEGRLGPSNKGRTDLGGGGSAHECSRTPQCGKKEGTRDGELARACAGLRWGKSETAGSSSDSRPIPPMMRQLPLSFFAGDIETELRRQIEHRF